MVDFGFAVRTNLFTAMTSTTDKAKLNIWVYINIFPTTAWVAVLGFVVFGAVWFSVANKQSLFESLAVMTRLLLQLGSDLSMRGHAAKAVLLAAAIGLNLLFIYYTCDLTAKMTSAPSKLDISSFQDVKNLGYKVTVIT